MPLIARIPDRAGVTGGAGRRLPEGVEGVGVGDEKHVLSEQAYSHRIISMHICASPFVYEATTSPASFRYHFPAMTGAGESAGHAMV